jgi:DNA (cytosine-5)-methyltransferase 1
MIPLILDLFCGAAGGWSLGMHRAGFETMAACEIDPWRRAQFAANFPGAFLYDDVQKLGADRVVRDCGRLPDIIVGSPPCQDASLANSRGRGIDGARTGLFRDALRLVAECRPRWCAFENSIGLRVRGADWIIGELERMGYACWPLVVSAGDIGAPHERKRVWFVAADAMQTKSIWRPAVGGRSGRAREIASANAYSNEKGLRWGLARAREIEENAANSDGDGLRIEQGRRVGADWRGEAVTAHHDRDAAREQVGRTGLAWADDWADWRGGLAGHLRVDHGLPAGVARACVSAYGDAVLPQITEAIGRAILKVERALTVLREPLE